MEPTSIHRCRRALTAIHPGEHLAEELKELGMSAAELARRLDVPTNRRAEILNGRRAITGDTALRVAHFFGTPALERLRHAVGVDPLDAQAHYRLSRAYRQLGRIPEADSEVATFKQLREAKERLHSAYVHIYKESGNSQALNPDVPQ
jgi:addiction module HigA family antidote